MKMILDHLQDLFEEKETAVQPESLALVFGGENRGISVFVADSPSFSAAQKSAGTHLNLTSEERIEMEKELNRLDKIEKTAITNITKTNNITEAEKELLAMFEGAGFHGEFLTMQEISAVVDFMSAGPGSEAEGIKIDMILDVAANSRSQSGMSGEQQKRNLAITDRVAEKYQRYISGEIDTSRRFDISPYVSGEKNIDLGFVSEVPYRDSDGFGEYSTGEDYERFYADMGAGHAENILESLEDDELLEYGIVSPEDIFVCGPYTAADAEAIEALPWKTSYSEIKSEYLEDVINGAVKDCGHSMEEQLARDFLKKTIAENRRPNAKTMMLLFAGLGLSCAENIRGRSIVFPELTPDINALNLSLRLCSFYTGKFLALLPADMKKMYGAARPISEKFFRALEGRIRDMSPEEMAAREAKYGAELLRMYDHLTEANSLYERLALCLEQSESSRRMMLAEAGEEMTA